MNPNDPIPENVIVTGDVLPPKKKRGLAYLLAQMGLSSFLVSVIVHIVFVLLAIFIFYRIVEPPKEKPVDFLPGGGGGGGSGGETAHKIKSTMRRSVSTAVSNKKILSSSANASFSLPETSDMMDSALPMDVTAGAGSGGGAGGGRGTGTGTGAGSGTGPGKGFGDGQLGLGALIPTLMKGRCSDSERSIMLRDAGGPPEIEAAVKKSLAWLKKTQKSNGSWGANREVAMTGLALLCYLGHCESTQSPEYGENVSKGITFLINNSLKNQGKLATSLADKHWVYEHAIATYALAEAFTFSKNLQFPIPELENAVVKGAMEIIGGQNQNGSWDYGYDIESKRNDLSVAGWQLQALKAAKATGLKFEGFDSCIRRAVDCIQDKTSEKGCYVNDGGFAYAGSGSVKPPMTSVAVLCLQHWNKETSKPAKEGVKFMMDGLEDRGKNGREKFAGKPRGEYAFKYDGDDDRCNLYSFYYASQCMRNAGGSEWKEMNKAIIEEILPAQNSDGSFKSNNTPLSNYPCKSTYLHCLNTLILEVYYRFLPATSSGSGRSSAFDDLR